MWNYEILKIKCNRKYFGFKDRKWVTRLDIRSTIHEKKLKIWLYQNEKFVLQKFGDKV